MEKLEFTVEATTDTVQELTQDEWGLFELSETKSYNVKTLAAERASRILRERGFVVGSYNCMGGSYGSATKRIVTTRDATQDETKAYLYIQIIGTESCMYINCNTLCSISCIATSARRGRAKATIRNKVFTLKR